MGSVKFNPTSKIIARLGLEAKGRAQSIFTSECARRMNKYIPESTKQLRNSVRVYVERIVYKTPYAHYQYIGKLYVDSKTKKGAFFNKNYGFWSRPDTDKEKTDIDLNYHSAGTGSRWDRKMVSAEMEEMCEKVRDYIAKGAK